MLISSPLKPFETAGIQKRKVDFDKKSALLSYKNLIKIYQRTGRSVGPTTYELVKTVPLRSGLSKLSPSEL